jgi:signal transduction histidine kinase
MVRRVREFREPRVTHRGQESAIFVPVLVDQEVAAIVELVDEHSRRFPLSDVRLLESFARLVASALKNIHAFEQACRLAADEERKRFAANLHDAINQSLFSANIIAEVLPRLWERDPVAGRTALNDLHHLVRGAAAELRGLLGDLQPRMLSNAELPILLRQLADAFTGRTNVPVAIKVEGEGVVPLEVQNALYRTCHEALTNIIKHAHATQVTIALRYTEDGVQLSIEDNGQGFVPDEVPTGHFGLSIMHDRLEAVGGRATVMSAPGKGTRITLAWTCDADAAPQSASRLH